MITNFVVAFGGSGARCLEALIYLKASGFVRSDLAVLVIDPDDKNGNVNDTIAQCQRYRRVSMTVADVASRSTSSLFCSALNDGGSEGIFGWEYPNDDKKFGEKINYMDLPSDQRHLIDLLYDVDDLDLIFDEGYVARAHIGSVDLFRSLRDALHDAGIGRDRQAASVAPPRVSTRPEPDKKPRAGKSNVALENFINELLAAAGANGDPVNLVVVGSLFGGTGASGMPALAALLKSEFERYAGLINVVCVPLAPYFSFPPPPQNSGNPDALQHPVGTKAALFHYAFSDVGYSRYYYLGAPDRVETNRVNVRGSDRQRNAAHYVELAAALAIADSLASPSPRGAQVTVNACRSVTVDWMSLPTEALDSLRKRLTTLATWSLFHARFSQRLIESQEHRAAKWAIDLAARSGRELDANTQEFKDIGEFAARFLAWAAQVEDSIPARLKKAQARALFNVPKDIGGSAPASLATLVPDGRAGETDPYHDIVNGLMVLREREKLRNAVGWYVDALSQATEGYCAQHYAWWR